jgi:hypothetical protein
MGGGTGHTASHTGGRGADRVRHGQWVPPVGGLWPTSPGHGRGAGRAGGRSHAGAPTLAHGGGEGLHGGAAAGCGRRGSASASWASRAQAQAPAGRSAAPVVRPGGPGPPSGWAGRGGQPARDRRWPTPFWHAVTPAPTRHDEPDGLYGTLGGHLPGAGRAPAAPASVAVLEPRAPPGAGWARGQSLPLGDAAYEPAPRAHATPPGHGPRADRPYLALQGGSLAARAYRSSPHQGEGRTPCTATDPGSPGPASWKDTSPSGWSDSSRERKRGNPSAERCVRYL